MAKEEVRDGSLTDLPENIQSMVLNIHKMIVDGCIDEFSDDKYSYMNKQQWAKQMLNELLAMPNNHNDVGAVRVFKKGNGKRPRFKCKIQMTPHVKNTRNTENEEFFHGMVRNAHTSIHQIVRRKYDVTLECSSVHGEPYEGFELWLKQKLAKVIWEAFEDKNTKLYKESPDPANDKEEPEEMIVSLNELPPNCQTFIQDAHDTIVTTMKKNGVQKIDESGSVGYTVLRKNNDIYEGSILLVDGVNMDDSICESVFNECDKTFSRTDPTKILDLIEAGDSQYFEFKLTGSYAKLLYEWLENNVYEESAKEFKEDAQQNTYNTDMSEAEAKKTLATVSQGVLNNLEKDPNYHVTQYTANIYSNVITKNLLPVWARGYRKFSIVLDADMNSTIVEFKVPAMTKDFVARFVEGRESMDGFLHRKPEIKVRMSPKIFNTMKNPNDAFRFFKAAIRYYDSGISKYSQKLMARVMKLNKEMKYLISTTKLSGIVTLPMRMLFVFDNVDMTDTSVFTISKDDINAINRFIGSIYSNYASPEKEKKKILDDLQKAIKSLNESVENIGEDRYLGEAVSDWYSGRYDQDVKNFDDRWINEQLDFGWSRSAYPQLKLLIEKTHVKKLKRIPRDLVAYITIETEAIQDANDKMMIASYCLSKIEIVEWYIELIDSGSTKYIVPHPRPYLVDLRTQLLACYKKIMAVKIKNPQDKSVIDTPYPAGYEG